MVHIHAESKNFNASGDDANDIQVDLLFWFFIIFLINLLTIIGTSSRRAWYRNEGKYDIVFAPKNKFYDIAIFAPKNAVICPFLAAKLKWIKSTKS